MAKSCRGCWIFCQWTKVIPRQIICPMNHAIVWSSTLLRKTLHGITFKEVCHAWKYDARWCSFLRLLPEGSVFTMASEFGKNRIMSIYIIWSIIYGYDRTHPVLLLPKFWDLYMRFQTFLPMFLALNGCLLVQLPFWKLFSKMTHNL